MLDLSITIISINDIYWVTECLERIYQYTKGITFEVILVVNQLKTEDLKKLEETYPQVNIQSLPGLHGFTQNQNLAIRMAKGRYILIFNDDALIDNDLFSKMVAFLDNNLTIGAVMPQLIYPDGSFQLGGRGSATPWSVGCYEMKLHRLFPRWRLFSAYPMTYKDKNKPCEVETASGACLMLRRELLEQVGLMDERYFFGMDDIEWSRRIRQHGWKIYYMADSKLLHVSQATAKNNIRTAIYMQYLGTFLYFYVYFGWFQASIFRIFLAVGSIIQIIVWLLTYLVSNQRRDLSKRYILGRIEALHICADPGLKEKIMEISKQNPNTDFVYRHGII
jgi:GT2 family glycosyltransferase